MGTRSTIHVYEGKKHVLSIDNQYDGYLSGVGADLYEFLSKGQVVNGLGSGDKSNFNGVGCLAAQLVAKFKTGPGGCYITDKKDRQEYNYFVMVNDLGQVNVKISSWDRKYILKNGSIKDLLDLCIKDGYSPKTTLSVAMGE